MGKVLLIVAGIALLLGVAGAIAVGSARKPEQGRKLLSSCVGLTSEADCLARCAGARDCLSTCNDELKKCDGLRGQVR